MRADRVWRHFDWMTLSFMLLLTGVGFVMIAVASQPYAPPGHPYYFAQRQAIWVGLGLGVVALMAAIPYEKFRLMAPWIYGVSVMLLVGVLALGHTVLGGQRWINVGPFQLQPSEFAKMAIIITLATTLDRHHHLTRWRDLVWPLGHVAIPMLLIIKQPDLSTTLVFTVITAGMLFIAGTPIGKWLLIFPGGLSMMILWIYVHLTFHVPLPLHQYQLQRLLIFLHPNSDPSGAGYNVIQARIAVGSGGLWGRGFSGTTNQLGFLPEAYTDFIYAVVGETLGFAGSMALLGIYLLLIIRGIFIAICARDRFGTFLAIGVSAMFSFHVIESAGMVAGVMPVGGIPLPFLSYGGSAYLTDAAAIGVLINVHMRRHVPETISVARIKIPGHGLWERTRRHRSRA